MAPKKRKRDGSETGAESSTSGTICVIHFPDSSEKAFTPLTEERLSKLLEIRQTRLALPDESKQGMTEICVQNSRNS